MEPAVRLRRHPPMTTLRPAARILARPPVLVLAVLALVAACGSPGLSASAGVSKPPAASVAPVTPVDGPEAAVAAIRSRVPLLDGIGPRDPDLIGQSAAWDATAGDTGWRVTFEVGWGDCQAGCIDRHTWSWDVGRDGSLAFVAEEGTPLPEDILAGLRAGSTATGVAGRATGGPTCPVEVLGDPACLPRLVGGVELVLRSAAGDEVARVTTDGSGLFRLALPAGAYTLEAPAVEGFMGGPAPAPFTVQDGAEAWLDLAWDTGIR
jgi:hypothetical protein